MVNKNLIRLLKSFTKAEFSEFEKFAASPYFARDRNVIPLLRYLKKLYPEYPEEKINLEFIHKKIFPGKPFSEAAIRMQVSVLISLCKDFLSVSKFLENKNNAKFYLLEELENRDISEILISEISQLEKNIDSEKSITLDYINSAFKLNTFKISQYEMEGKNTEIPELYYSNGDFLPVDVIVKLINNVQDIISARNSYKVNNKKVFSEALLENINFDKLIEYAAEKKPKGYQLVLFYYYRLKFYTSNGDINFFYKAKDVVFNHWNSFAHFECYCMMLNLANCCWWQIKLGNMSFKADLFEIYKLWLKTDFIIKPGYSYMDIQNYKNILYLALNLNEFKWAEDFMNEYSSKLSIRHSDDVKNYSLALLHYNKKEYDKALDMLKRTDYKNYVYKMECYLLMLKIYYEINAADSLFSLADSYKHFLDKHKNENLLVGQRHINFVKTLIKLQKVKLSLNRAKLMEVKKITINNKLITSREWLLKQITLLESID